MWENSAVTIAYLSHPVGDRDLPDDAVRYGDNMAGTHDWIAFLTIAAPDLVLECSWISMNVALSPRFHGGKFTTSSHALLLACGLLVQVGGLISPHMRQLAAWSRTAGIPVLDLVDLGPRPPWHETDRVRGDITRRLDELGL